MGLGDTIWQALQGLGQGVRDLQSYEKYGPDWRERMEYDRSLRDLTLRGKEYEMEREREMHDVQYANARAAALQNAASIGALQLEGEVDRIGEVPQQTMDMGGYDVNLPSAEAVPMQPELPQDIRSLFPDLGDDALARLVRGKHAEGKRPMKMLDLQIRQALAEQAGERRRGDIAARGDEARETAAYSAALRTANDRSDERADRRERERIEAERRAQARAEEVKRTEAKVGAERRKQRMLSEAEEAFRNLDENKRIDQGELERRKKEAQRTYEEELLAAGHTITSDAPATPARTPTPAAPQGPPVPAGPLKGKRLVGPDGSVWLSDGARWIRQ
jgi:hypothetical protein